MDPFLNSLRNRRAQIQARIEREQARPAPDSLRLYGLKKLKLRFREQIEYLERLDREGQATVIPVIRRRSFTPAMARLGLEGALMHLQPRQATKLGRVVGYGGVALIVAWSLLALAAYVGIEAAVDWMAGMGAADGLIAWFAQIAAPLDGPLIAIVWLVGVAILGVVTVLIRRLTSAAT